MSRKVSGSAEGRIRPKPCGGFGFQVSGTEYRVSSDECRMASFPLDTRPSTLALLAEYPN
jgi:hypothetical protein